LQDFVLAVHGRAASAGASGGKSKRAEIMLELVMDIKNNRLREGKASKAAAAAAAAAGKKGRGGAAAVLQPGLLRWLKQLGVDDVTLSNIGWAKLVQPNKKGE
jgi:nucleolar MIF4G domain-containing protein 1